MVPTVGDSLRIVHLASLARCGETLVQRALSAHPQVHVVFDLLEPNRPEDLRLFHFLRVWPGDTVPRGQLERHLAPGIVPAGKTVLLLKQGIFQPPHRPASAFGLLRNPYASFCSLWRYDTQLAGLPDEAERNRRHWFAHRLPRLMVWADCTVPWLLPALRAEREPARQFLAFWRARAQQVLAQTGTVLRYEAFVQHPEAELRRLCAALDLSFDERMLQAHTGYLPGQRGHGGIDLGAAIRPAAAWRTDPQVDLAPFAAEVDHGPVDLYRGFYGSAAGARPEPATIRHDLEQRQREALARGRTLALAPGAAAPECELAMDGLGLALGPAAAEVDEAAAQRALLARLDRAQAGLRPLLAPLDSLCQGLREQHRADPLALALELSLLLKTDPDSHHALVALLPATGLLQAADGLPLALAAQALDPQDHAAQGRVAALLAELPPLAAGKLFRHPVMPRNGALLTALAERALGRGPALALAPQAWFNLFVLGFAALPAPLFEALRQRLAQGVGPGALEALLRTLAQRFRSLAPVPPAPARRLRIALCLSGQLRGWRHAMGTWGALGLQGHAVDVYLHTWRDLGRRLPDPGIVPSVARVFGPGPFAQAWLHAGRRQGAAELECAYPTLFAALRAGQAIDEGEVRAALQQRFGGRVETVVEDGAAPAFAGWSNQDRMHYKIWVAQQMLPDAGRGYDLVLRLRPDKTLCPGPALPDWPAIAAESRAHGALFCEEPPGLREGLVMGDQFAAGVPEVMAGYAAAWTLTPEARSAGWPGFPVDFTGHASLAWTCLWQGLRPRVLPGPVFGAIAEDEVLGGAPLRALLLADMPAGPRDDTDRALLAALEGSPR